MFLSTNTNIYLFIDEPDVQAEKAWIHADVGVEIEISCTVYAEPSAEVSFWFSIHISEYQNYKYRKRAKDDNHNEAY